MMTDIEKANLIHIAKRFKRNVQTYASKMKKYSDDEVYYHYFDGLSEAYDYAYQDLCDDFPFLKDLENGED